MADVHAETQTPRTTGKALAGEPLAPPIERIGVLRWLKENLFNSPLNTVLTLLCLWLLWETIPPILNWAIFDATISGESRDACTGEGACWTFIKVRFDQFMYGFYPATERWRVNLAFIILIIGAIPLFIGSFRHKIALAGALLFVYPVIAFYLFYGGGFGLRVVETPLWGGLFLTLVIAGVGIVASLPLGILFALGRRSTMPVVRLLSVGFIELMRAVPLITVLFMASVMLPLFLPEGVNFDKLLRALVGVALFSAAYMAEVVRGGLQAITKGQYEAANALGLSYWKTMGLIILPQALKIVIPGIVNTFIGLFKDTTLVLIIGLFDLLGIVQASLTDANWLGLSLEGYIFAGVGFWIFCFAMSRYSMHVENKLHTGHKR
ncbi:MAG TPA: amino acid ABC transporter permease [Geminicoccaceae bacterium]|nr:amino acid ABC transporter permease [Geminicoccaceae bacterium]